MLKLNAKRMDRRCNVASSGHAPSIRGSDVAPLVVLVVQSHEKSADRKGSESKEFAQTNKSNSLVLVLARMGTSSQSFRE